MTVGRGGDDCLQFGPTLHLDPLGAPFPLELGDGTDVVDGYETTRLGFANDFCSQ